MSLMTELEQFARLRMLLSLGKGALSWILPPSWHAHELGPPLCGLFSEIRRNLRCNIWPKKLEQTGCSSGRTTHS